MDLATARRVARREGWLSQTPPSFRRAVLDRTFLRVFEADATIHIAGDHPGGIYGLIAGSIRVSIAGSEGPYFIHLLRPVTWVGEGPAISGQARPATLSAARATTLLYIPAHVIPEIVQEDPAFWRFFVVPLMGHLEVSFGALADLMIRDHVKRLVAVLLRLGGCRTASPSELGPIEIDASQEDFAVMANIGLTATRSALRKLETAHLIEQAYRRVAIIAPDRLREMLTE